MACVQLVNALVSTPDDLDFRLHLRNEFVREGLNDPLLVRVQIVSFILALYSSMFVVIVVSRIKVRLAAVGLTWLPAVREIKKLIIHCGMFASYRISESWKMMI